MYNSKKIFSTVWKLQRVNIKLFVWIKSLPCCPQKVACFMAVMLDHVFDSFLARVYVWHSSFHSFFDGDVDGVDWMCVKKSAIRFIVSCISEAMRSHLLMRIANLDVSSSRVLVWMTSGSLIAWVRKSRTIACGCLVKVSAVLLFKTFQVRGFFLEFILACSLGLNTPNHAKGLKGSR